MWNQLTPEQVERFYRVPPAIARMERSDFYESELQPHGEPDYDGPWSLIRVERHPEGDGVISLQIANIEPEQLDWEAFNPLSAATGFLLMTGPSVKGLIDLLQGYAAQMARPEHSAPPFMLMDDAALERFTLADQRYPDHRQASYLQQYDPRPDPASRSHATILDFSSVEPHPAYYFFLGISRVLLPSGEAPANHSSNQEPAQINLDRSGLEALADLLSAELPYLQA